jgi:hypothetical protein
MTDTGFPEGELGIIVIGSLLHRDELAYLFDGLPDRSARVRLDGYRRVFDAVADRRETVGDRCAVLNLHSADAWCNGVLVTDLSPREFGIYARRETTYRFEIVDSEAVTYYENESVALPDEIIVASDAPSHADVKPIPSYVKTCLSGARQWGETFYDEFLETTAVASGESLRSYLDIDRK